MKIENLTTFRSSDIGFGNDPYVWFLPPTRENMERYLDDLNERISNAPPSDLSEIERWWGTLPSDFSLGEFNAACLAMTLAERRKVYIYLGRFQEAAADAEKINALGLKTEDSEEGTIYLDFEIDAFHHFAMGEEEKGYAALNDLAKEGSALAILLLKAKGRPIPDIEYISYISNHASHPAIPVKDLFCQGNYEEAIKKIDTCLKKDCYGRDNLIALRGIFKAMANDYEGAISDLDQTINLSYPYASNQNLAARGLIHYLNNDLEKAKIDFGLIPYTRIPREQLILCLGEFNGFKWDALIMQEVLGL